MKNYDTVIIVSAVIFLGGAAAFAYLSSKNSKWALLKGNNDTLLKESNI